MAPWQRSPSTPFIEIQELFTAFPRVQRQLGAKLVIVSSAIVYCILADGTYSDINCSPINMSLEPYLSLGSFMK